MLRVPDTVTVDTSNFHSSAAPACHEVASTAFMIFFYLMPVEATGKDWTVKTSSFDSFKHSNVTTSCK